MDMSSSSSDQRNLNRVSDPLSFRNILGGIIVTVVSGVLIAFIIQDARFAPKPVSSAEMMPDLTEQANVAIPLPSSTPLPTPTVTASPTPTMMPTPTPLPSPSISKFEACFQPCNGLNDSRVFPEGVRKIHARWWYEDFPRDAVFTRTWSMNGHEWVKYVCTWPGPASGMSDVRLSEPDGLHSGNWTVTIAVNNEVLLQETMVVEGNWTYWYPVGVIYDCFGAVPNQSSFP